MYHYQLVCHLTSPLDPSYIVSNHKLPSVQIHAHSEYMKEEYWNETKQKSNRCIIRAFYITNFFDFRSIIMAEPFTEFVHNDAADLNDVIEFFFLFFSAARALGWRLKLQSKMRNCQDCSTSVTPCKPRCPPPFLQTDTWELCTAVRSDWQLSSLQHCGQKWRTAVKSAALRSEVCKCIIESLGTDDRRKAAKTCT